jgi:hypothetical protein
MDFLPCHDDAPDHDASDIQTCDDDPETKSSKQPGCDLQATGGDNETPASRSTLSEKNRVDGKLPRHDAIRPKKSASRKVSGRLRNEGAGSSLCSERSEVTKNKPADAVLNARITAARGTVAAPPVRFVSAATAKQVCPRRVQSTQEYIHVIMFVFVRYGPC